jgi:hypothetical protein
VHCHRNTPYGSNGLVSSRSEGSTGASSAAYSWDDIGRLLTQGDGYLGTSADVNWTLSYNPASQTATDARVFAITGNKR